MATRAFFSTDSKLALNFLRKPSLLSRPQLSAIPESLRHLPPMQESQPPHSASSLADFLGPNQKLFVGESVRECFQNNGPAVGGGLWASGRGGSSPRKDESEEEVDDGDVDEFGDEDLDEGEMLDEFDDVDNDEDFKSDDDDESDEKFRRRK